MKYRLTQYFEGEGKTRVVFFHIALNQQHHGGIVQFLLINLRVRVKKMELTIAQLHVEISYFIALRMHANGRACV